MFKLTEDEADALFAAKYICTVCWTNKAGFPVGMPHNFVWDDGKFWVTTTTRRNPSPP